MATHNLLTQELRGKLPPLYSTEKLPSLGEAVAVLKFFTPWTNWTWYAVEFDGHDLFWGLVDGFEREYGYFSLSELEGLRGPAGLRIERDLYFEPTRLSELDSTLRRNSQTP